jgi:DNA-directed RNA polymerase subunit beta'
MNPANGQPVVFPSQDMVLGLYMLTKERKGDKGEGKYFSSPNEVVMALEVKAITYHALINVNIDGEYIETTAGRVIFNDLLPPIVEYVNDTLSDKRIRSLIVNAHETYGAAITVQMLDIIKDTGYRYATKLGATIGMDDIQIPAEKKTLIAAANGEVDKIQTQYISGHITSEERYNRVVEVWGKTNEDLTNVMMNHLRQDKDGFNNVFMMADSGARGSRNQIRQLAGMRGLMAKPSGDIIELPIRSNFKEGLSVIEFFISTNGARKGLADTALKTADAGYLTRRLVDIAQDVVVNEDDCGTINGIEITALKDGEEIVESLKDRISGRFTLERVKHPITGEVLVDVNNQITDHIAEQLEEIGVESVKVRTVLTCEAKQGVCRKCYGRDLATKKTVNIGEAVGIIAAQSIGQPGTQLTMRTFHVGGTASTVAEDNRISMRYPVLVQDMIGTSVDMGDKQRLFTRKGYLHVARVLETIEIKSKDKLLVETGQKVIRGEAILKRGSEEILADEIAFIDVKEGQVLLVSQSQKLEIRNGSTMLVHEGQVVPAEETIAIFDPFSDPIIAEQNGTVRFEDIIKGTTLKQEINEDTGNTEQKITEFSLETLQPRIVVVDKDGKDIAAYYLPGNAYLNVEDGTKIKAGRILAKMLKESTKTQDITGGLPRVGELFEARRPKEPAVLSKVSGKVLFEGISKGKRVINVEDEYGNVFKQLVPMGKHLLVRDGDLVEACEPLCEGPIDPHDILDIRGENALQSFLVDEVQEVYRMQGVDINDKHIGVIIRQMMRKVEIIDVGDTHFIFGQHVDKYNFRKENDRVVKQGGLPSMAKPLLLGITRASLNIDSWISAASFQETTRVLTNAAIAGEYDYLRGLKENVIIGHVIPAGTGMKKYRNPKLYSEETGDLDAHVQEILEQRKKEQELKAIEESQGSDTTSTVDTTRLE